MGLHTVRHAVPCIATVKPCSPSTPSSSLGGSFPEIAPPPCAPQSPYVSVVIFCPGRLASPRVPPVMNLPEGLMYMCVKSPTSETAGLPFLGKISDSVRLTTSFTICRYVSSMLSMLLLLIHKFNSHAKALQACR